MPGAQWIPRHAETGRELIVDRSAESSQVRQSYSWEFITWLGEQFNKDRGWNEIVSELITNAAKYGDGRIAISLRPDPAYGHALSVCNGGPALPDGFDPGASTGLGMRIIQSFARQIGGELRIGQGDGGKGARFTVLFPAMPNPAIASISSSSLPHQSKGAIT